MKAHFLHFADCHLGYRQYNLVERANDFARAFLAVIDAAIAAQVDFVLLAGDLFQKRSIEALTLNQAMVGLERLAAARIPCVAVEGNHELVYQDERIGWIEFLAQRRLLTLLNAQFEGGEARLSPYANRKGSYIDLLPGLRIHGLRYYGASTARVLESYARALAALPADNIEYTIFMAHAGMEGVLADQSGGLSYRQWSVLRPYVDYLALGHVHKPFEQDGWIYNPGSTETCAVVETAWPERGYYLVEVDTNRPRGEGEPKHSARLHANRRRPFHRLNVKTDLHTSPEALYNHCRQLLQRKARDLGVRAGDKEQQPVVELQLTGVLPFDHAALEIGHLEELIQEIFEPLTALVKNFTRAADFAIETEEGLGRAELERQVIADLLGRDARFVAHNAQWTQLVLSLKKLALDGASPEAILTELSSQMESIADLSVDSGAEDGEDHANSVA